MNKPIEKELNRLRNRHVARTLNIIGDADDKTVRAVKRGFSEITKDYKNIHNIGHTGYENSKKL